MGTKAIKGLKAALTKAEADYAAACLSGAAEPAFQNLMRAERELAAAEGRAYAVAEDFPFVWEVGAPLPTLTQSDDETYLLFLLADETDHVGLVGFDFCLATSFGAPNDETFAGHPLYGSGFEPYGAMRVVGSPWIEELRRMNSVHPRHSDQMFSDLQHFIFAFHDTTFECVARSYVASREEGPLKDAVKRAVDRLH